jgi:gliding motility-associated lipoprotein GldH
MCYNIYICKNFFPLKKVLYILSSVLLIASCTPVDLYEKTVTVPGHAWQSTFRPTFDFIITDSTTPYKIFLVLRHNEKYNFNNIYVNLHITAPGEDTAVIIRRDLALATNEGWEGTGMDDIYEIRLLLADRFPLKTGTYRFAVEQIMREDPLDNVLNVGVRLERERK